MVTIATFSKPEEAHLLRMRLESSGIPAFLQDENLIQMDWLLSNAVGGVRVQVADEDLQAASNFLEADHGAEPDPTEPESERSAGSRTMRSLTRSVELKFTATLYNRVSRSRSTAKAGLSHGM